MVPNGWWMLMVMMMMVMGMGEHFSGYDHCLLHHTPSHTVQGHTTLWINNMCMGLKCVEQHSSCKPTCRSNGHVMQSDFKIVISHRYLAIRCYLLIHVSYQLFLVFDLYMIYYRSCCLSVSCFLHIWRFPKMEVPLHHPFIDWEFPWNKPSSYWGSPIYGNSWCSLVLHDLCRGNRGRIRAAHKVHTQPSSFASKKPGVLWKKIGGLEMKIYPNKMWSYNGLMGYEWIWL